MRARILPRCLLLAVCAITLVPCAFAQSTVFRTRRSASSSWNPLLPLTFGVGIDYEDQQDAKEYALPVLVEYNFTRKLRVTAETGFKVVDSSDPEVGKAEGIEDIETGIDYDFLRERRYRPGLTAVGLIRWPTATDKDVGDPGVDYTAGLTLSKDCVHVDLESNFQYTYASAAELPDLFEFSLAVTYPLTYRWELQLEGTGQWGVAGANQADANEKQIQFGFTWEITPFQSLEGAALYKNDHTLGLSVGWQYNFGGD